MTSCRSLSWRVPWNVYLYESIGGGIEMSMKNTRQTQVLKIVTGNLLELKSYASQYNLDFSYWTVDKSNDSAAHLICRYNHASLLWQSLWPSLGEPTRTRPARLLGAGVCGRAFGPAHTSLLFVAIGYLNQRPMSDSLTRPLHEADKTGSISCIRLLLAYGSIVDSFKIAD